jgi:hypothetical protein
MWYAVRHLALTGTVGPMQPFHTTNGYLGGITHSREPSERLLDLLALLPEKTPVAVVYRETEDLESFTAFAVTYFAWPREVRAFPLPRDNAASQLKAALAEKHISATFFCGVPPPPHSPLLVAIGHGLVVAPRTEP